MGGSLIGLGKRYIRTERKCSITVSPRVYPISGSWRGKLFLSSRPRGGDWLEDEGSGWRRYGIDQIVSLLTGDEEQELGLGDEASEALKHDLAFVSYPIPDRGVP